MKYQNSIYVLKISEKRQKKPLSIPDSAPQKKRYSKTNKKKGVVLADINKFSVTHSYATNVRAVSNSLGTAVIKEPG